MFDDDRAYLLEIEAARRQAGTPRDGSAPASDWQSAGASKILSLSEGAVLLQGRIIEGTGVTNCYRVSLEGARSLISGILLTSGGLSLVGARPTTTLVPGARVLVAWKPHYPECWILGCLPDAIWHPSQATSDVIVPGSNVGIQADQYLRGPFLLDAVDPVSGDERSGVQDASAGRPSDTLNLGEWGATAETGIGIHIDPAMAYLRVNEDTGVFAFYDDERLRVGGHTLEVTSSARDRLDYHHGDYVTSEEGHAQSFLEVLGLQDDTGPSSYRTYTPEQVQQLLTHYYYIEPAYDDQQPFYRYMRYTGRLGGSWKDMVATWPGSPSLPQRYSVDQSMRNLLDIQAMLTGRYLVRSAKGIILAKYPRQVSPKRRRQATAAPIDTPSGTTPEAQMGTPGAVSDEEATLLRAGAFIDQLAYSANFEGLHPFWEQPSSWYVPEEGLAGGWIGSNGVVDHSALATQQLLSAPTPTTIAIDGRYGNALVWPNLAYIALLDDGGIAIGDGWGSEIKMTGGQMLRTAPGDIYDLPGRSYLNYSGYDVVLRAHNSVDVTAANRDLRLKAELNLMALAGNEKCGGILLESRAPTASYDFSRVGQGAVATGIILNAPNSQVVTMAEDNVVLASRHTHKVPTGASAGRFCVDVGQGDGKIATYSRSFESRLGTTTPGEGGYKLDMVFSSAATSFVEHAPASFLASCDIQTAGSILATNCITAGGWFHSTGGHIATAYSPDWYGRTADLAGAAATTLAGNLSALATHVTALGTYQGTSTTQLKTDYVDVAAGDVEDAVYSLRTATDYGTDSGFVLYESLWQQQARAVGTTLPTWSEPTVLVGVTHTAPHPGYTAWHLTSSGRKVDYTCFDQSAGQAEDRSSPGSPAAVYTAAEYDAPTNYVLDGNYMIVRTP